MVSILSLTLALAHCWQVILLVSAQDRGSRHDRGLIRSRRQTWQADNKDMRGFAADEKKALLNRHNELRATRGASDMMRMDWNADLERTAQAWADRCVFDHSESRKNLAGFQYVGENLFASTGMFDPANVVQKWFDEYPDYNYNTLQCKRGKMCGHYTQVVWATSKELGCGVRYCSYLAKTSWASTGGYNVVCQYGPGGNIIGYKPFKLGATCSQCPADAQYCTNGLCYHTDVVDTGIGMGNSAEDMFKWNIAFMACLVLSTSVQMLLSGV